MIGDSGLMADDEFTSKDHQFRDSDHYASIKYELTLEFLERHGLRAGQLVLNLGCGVGTFNRLAAGAGYRVIGVEPDPIAFSVSVAQSGPMIEVRNTGVFDLDIPGDVDAVVMHDVLEHIEDDRRALEIAVGVLKQRGLLFISVPANQLLYGRHDELLGHYRRYSRRSLREIIPNSISEISCRYVGLLGLPYVFWNSRIKRVPYSVVTDSDRKFSRAFEVACKIERKIHAPLGTSLLFAASKS